MAVRLLAAISGLILIVLGLWSGLGALSIGSESTWWVVLIFAAWAVGALVVGVRLLLGRIGRATIIAFAVLLSVAVAPWLVGHVA